MHNDIHNFRYLLNDSISDIIGDIMTFAHGNFSIHYNVQIHLNAGADIAGANFVNLLDVFIF